ncbi:uncharacterized protein LOC143769052 [Ranitomeya variabilis]|uniref:uncharacterized protein LOC143769052 n=1 Tax=Ranitomeya variabilis TaxID=490064 RepID=UPI0040567F69
MLCCCPRVELLFRYDAAVPVLSCCSGAVGLLPVMSLPVQKSRSSQVEINLPRVIGFKFVRRKDEMFNNVRKVTRVIDNDLLIQECVALWDPRDRNHSDSVLI